MNINLHIDRLILDGVNISHSQHHLLQSSVEAELRRLLSEDAVSPSLANGGAMRGISAKDIQLGTSNNPVQLGQQIARAVYGGIGK